MSDQEKKETNSVSVVFNGEVILCNKELGDIPKRDIVSWITILKNVTFSFDVYQDGFYKFYIVDGEKFILNLKEGHYILSTYEE